MSDATDQPYPPQFGQAPQPPYGQPGPQPQYAPVPPHYPQYPQVYGQPPHLQGPFAVRKATNGLAIASMVLGILWIYWIGSILALVFGYVARKQIREQNQSGDGMAIAGIVLGWVGVGMVLLFVLLGIAGAWD